MDLAHLDYILRIAEERSITRAAERLFVTAPALNQQLQKLEGELGTPLFIRNRSDWQLTAAGEVYVQAAREILNIRKDACHRIGELASLAGRQYRVGLIPERGVNMFTAIYPEFHRRFPDVLLEPQECSVRTMQKLISRGELDLGLMTLTVSQKDDNVYHHMADEEIYLAVPAGHPLAGRGSREPEDAPDMGLESFREDPFIRIFQASTMHHLTEELFAQAGFVPRVLFSTSSNISKFRMVSAGVGCALLPAVFALPDRGIAYFRLPGHPRWEIHMCSRRGAWLGTALEGYLELCREYWLDGNKDGKFCIG